MTFRSQLVLENEYSERREPTSRERSILIAPSVLSADFARLGDEVRAVDAAGADWIHVDVMDGRFVPNITIGPIVLEAVNPGFGGQPFLSEMLPKIQLIRGICARRGVDPIIEVDGGENATTAAKAAAAGATAIVAGSAIFGAKDYAGAIAAIRAHATKAAAQP